MLDSLIHQMYQELRFVFKVSRIRQLSFIIEINEDLSRMEPPSYNI